MIPAAEALGVALLAFYLGLLGGYLIGRIPTQRRKPMDIKLTELVALRRWYFRVFPHYRRLELRSVTWNDAEKMLSVSEGPNESDRWRLAVPEEDNNQQYGMVYLERRERITE